MANDSPINRKEPSAKRGTNPTQEPDQNMLIIKGNEHPEEHQQTQEPEGGEWRTKRLGLDADSGVWVRIEEAEAKLHEVTAELTVQVEANRLVQSYISDLHDQQKAATEGMAILNGEILALREQLREVTARLEYMEGLASWYDYDQSLTVNDVLKAQEQEIAALKEELSQIKEGR